ncbi:MAG: hypothetical protein ABWZ88_08610 [Variovorax sp.]
MTSATEPKLPLHRRAIHEAKELAVLTAYLFVTIGAVITMEAAVLHTHGVEWAHWGVGLVKALVLAKFVMLGKVLKIGEHNKSSPLIWPTLHKVFAFLVLLVVLTILEEVVVGLVHHRSVADALGELFGVRLQQTLAGIFILLLVLIPLFAFEVLSEALGERRLVRMFLVDRNAGREG